MRKRRVGVTAKSRQNEGNQATGTLQFGTEMAAPLVWRTPTGTCGQKLQIECGWKHGDNGARSNGQEANQRRSGDGTSEASLPSPPSTSCCDAATRQGSPYGSLG